MSWTADGPGLVHTLGIVARVGDVLNLVTTHAMGHTITWYMHPDQTHVARVHYRQGQGLTRKAQSEREGEGMCMQSGEMISLTLRSNSLNSKLHAHANLILKNGETYSWNRTLHIYGKSIWIQGNENRVFAKPVDGHRHKGGSKRSHGFGHNQWQTQSHR